MSTQRKVRPIPDALDPEVTLATEKRWLPWMGLLAIVAGVLSLVGYFLQQAIDNGGPDDVGQVKTIAQSLVTYASDQQGQGIRGHQAEVASYLGDQAFQVVLAVVLIGLGFIAAGTVLSGLLWSAYRRRPSFPRWFMWLPIVGGFAFGLGTTIAKIYAVSKFSDFNALDPVLQTNSTAADALVAGSDLTALTIITVLGQMFIAVGIGAAALSAMNVGLLTRVMGVIGMLLALLVVLPVVDPSFLRAFWLIALGFTLLGRWPGGRPPSWASGVPQPWPTRAMQMEAAERARAQKAAADERPAPKPKASNGGRKRRK